MPNTDTSVQVSVIVPMYNDEQYVDECIGSILGQTFKDLEVICVDDASTDSTLAHVRSLAEVDQRVRIVSHGSNLGTSQARKDGVATACGKYLMFVDHDDYLESSLVEHAYKSIESTGADIVHFRTCVENCAGLPERRIENVRQALNKMPPQVVAGDVLDGRSSAHGLLERCFLENAFGTALWNKIYRTDVCKLAFAEVPDGSFPAGEDVLAMFHVLRYAKRYSAIDFVGYHYCFGRGQTGHNILSRNQFETHCQSVRVVQSICNWISASEDNNNSSLYEVLSNIRSGLLNELIVKALEHMDTDDVSWALLRVCEVWKLEQEELIVLLAKARFFECKKVTPYFSHRDDMAYEPRVVRTVALYYRNIQNGGAQRVVCMVANSLAQQKSGGNYRYRVILITDEGPTSNEYGLDGRIERYFVPDHAQSIKEMYVKRAQAWREILDKARPDVIIDSLWENPVSFWDMLVVKSHATHPAVLFHCHSFFGPLFGLRGQGFSNVRSMMSLADGLVTLSNADEMFWSSYCPRVCTIPNPSAFRTSESDRTSGSLHEVLWLGRISPEKQVGDIVRAMALVHKRIPDAICRIVGEGDEQYASYLQTLVEQFGLQDTVLFEGFSASVEEYYRRAAVFCVTSKYEGFTLTLYEAAAFGVPTIMYELPWLEYGRNIKGGISVTQGDYRALADSVVDLLQDGKKWKQCSDELFESSIAYQHLDIGACWNNVLSQLECSVSTKAAPSNETRLLSLVSDFHTECIERYTEELGFLRSKLQRAYDEKSEINAKLQRTYQEKSEINAKLQRTYKEKAERGVTIRELKKQLANSKKKIRKQATEIDGLKVQINELSRTFTNRVVRVGKRLLKRR